MSPDDFMLFGVSHDSAFAPFFKAKNVGMGLFAAVGFAVFVKGLVDQAVANAVDRAETTRPRYAFYALACSVSFFVLLPAMHERYLMPAVVASLLLAAIRPTKINYSILLTFCSYMNMALILPLEGEGLWILTSAALSISFVAIMFEFFDLPVRSVVDSFRSPPILNRRYLPEMLWVTASILILASQIGIKNIESRIELADNQHWLTELAAESVDQDWGRMRINRSVDGKRLRVADTTFTHGIGTHADSAITFNLERNYSRFEFRAGLDEEAKVGIARFSVHADGKQIWRSASMATGEISDRVSLDVRGVTRLTLHVSSAGSNTNDHADWLNPVLTRADST